MIIDAFLSVMTDQAITATAVSEDSIDATAARDLGTGEPLTATLHVKTTATAGGAATLTFEIISADNDALTSNVVSHASSTAIAVATLVAGYQLTLGVPSETNIGADRFWGTRSTIATGPLTAGVFDAWFGPRDFGERNNQYASGLRVTGF